MYSVSRSEYLSCCRLKMSLRVSSTSVVLINQPVNVVSGSLGIRELLLDWSRRAKTRLVHAPLYIRTLLGAF